MKRILLFLLLFLSIQIFSQYKNQSIGFKENKGQIADQKGKPNNAVKYLLNSGGLNVQLRKNGFSYDIYEVKKIPLLCSKTAKPFPYKELEKEKTKEPEYSLEYIYHRIDIDFVNSSLKVEFVTDQESKDFDNYYNIPNKPEGITGVHQYKQITYKNIYPNIDVVFTIPNDPKKTVEYNFVVHPKGKISDIQLKFKGAETELVDNKIQMNVRFGKMEETIPLSWTEDGTSKKEIAVGYRKIKNDVYGFETSSQVSDKTLIIDPVPVRLWGTFYGDERNIHYTLGNVSLSTDSSGNAYMTGTTTASNSSYATTGAHQSSIPPYHYGSSNGIIVKFSPDGNRLWGTYYGGEGLNPINDIKIDSQNNIIIIGRTGAQSNISTVGSYKPNLTDDSDAFLAKFNNSGVRIWGTYFGGENSDSGEALDIDNNDNIYIVGSTLSKTGIAINSNFQTQLNDGYYKADGFLAKFKVDGNLIWSTYVGGDGRDELKAIVIKDNYLITGGDTESFNNITTTGVFQENHDSNNHSDCVVYKFSLDGQRIWATYYGGEQVDYLFTVEVDNEDNVYLGGETASFINMTTSGSFDSINQSLYEGFFAKLNSKGERVWGTYLGSAYVYSLIFKNNSIYIGATDIGTYHLKLTTPCSYRPITTHSEGYIGKFSKEGSLIWGTYIGGNSGINDTTKITFNDENNIFVSGTSSQNNGIADSSSYQSSILGSFSNYFLMKFSEDNISSPKISTNSPICNGNSLELKASGGTTYSWTGPNGFTSTDQNPIITNTTILNGGEYSCTITGTGGCDDTKKIDVVIMNTPAPSGNANQAFCSGQNPTLENISITGESIKWYNAIINGNLLPNNSILQNGLTYYASQTINSCEGSRLGITVSIQNTPGIPTGDTNPKFCKSENATLNTININEPNLKWYASNTDTAPLANTTLVQNNTTYYVSQTIGCESDRLAVLVNVNDTELPIANNPQTFCINENATITDIAITGNSIIWYDAETSGNVLTTSAILENKNYYVTQTNNNCESNRLAIAIQIQDTQAPVADTNQRFCIQENAAIKNIKISGQNIKWYNLETVEPDSSQSILLENGKTYYATQTINNCESEMVQITIQILDATTSDCINYIDELPYPKFFTPNSDNYNDTWTIDFAYLAPNSSIRIFDRYGKLIKVLNINQNWDGTYNGYNLPSSDYWFVVTRLNGAEFKSHFSLKR